jgi:hypothetical protein
MAASRSAAAKQRSLTEKRRMILLEIVETEISYVHDLQALVHIYLPQLAALPSVTDTIDALVIRATRDLLTFHVQFAEHLVNIFKYCGMGYGEATPEIVETATKRIADIFVHEVRFCCSSAGILTCRRRASRSTTTTVLVRPLQALFCVASRVAPTLRLLRSAASMSRP